MIVLNFLFGLTLGLVGVFLMKMLFDLYCSFGMPWEDGRPEGWGRTSNYSFSREPAR